MFAGAQICSEAERVTAYNGLILFNGSNLAEKKLAEIKPQTVPITLQINIFLLSDVHRCHLYVPATLCSAFKVYVIDKYPEINTLFHF